MTDDERAAAILELQDIGRRIAELRAEHDLETCETLWAMPSATEELPPWKGDRA